MEKSRTIPTYFLTITDDLYKFSRQISQRLCLLIIGGRSIAVFLLVGAILLLSYWPTDLEKQGIVIVTCVQPNKS